MEAYVFIRAASEKLLAAPEQLYDAENRVRAVATLSGDFDLLARVETADDDPRALPAVVQNMRTRTGAHSTSTAVLAEALSVPSFVPSHHLVTTEWLSFSRVRTEPGQARAVLNELYEGRERLGVVAVAIVIGAFDLLVEVAGETFKALAQSLVEINSRPGIVWSDSGLANLVPRSEQAAGL